MDIDWVIAVTCAAAFAYCLPLLKPIGRGLGQLKKLPRGVLAAILAVVLVAAVVADKTNSPPRMLVQQMLGLPVAQEDIARGYRLDHVATNAGHSAAMPTNASYLGNAHIRGAASGFGRNVLDFGDWSFPHGSNCPVL